MAKIQVSEGRGLARMAVDAGVLCTSAVGENGTKCAKGGDVDMC